MRFIDVLFFSCKDVSLGDCPSLFFSLWAIAWSQLAPFLQLLSAQGVALLSAEVVSRG